MTNENNNLSLVFLPGMDGTGKLFAPLLGYFKQYQCQVIKLPKTGSQDYLYLGEYVKDSLPANDFIVIAESFSGPIAAQLARQKIKNLKGFVFVATFLSSPNTTLLSIARRLPIKLLTKSPGARYFIKKLFLGNHAGNHLIEQFQSTVNQVPVNVLKQRIQTMQKLTFQEFNNRLPAVYILPDSDKLVPKSKVKEFQKCFSHLQVKEIDGPHFILQAESKNSANIIIDFIGNIEAPSKNL